MLTRNYRFVVYNACGQTIAANSIKINVRRWSYSPSTMALWESAVTNLLTSNVTLATASYLYTATIDNSTQLYIGGVLEFTVTAPTLSSGPVILFLQHSVDGGTTWPDNGQGIVVATLNFSGAGKQVVTFEV